MSKALTPDQIEWLRELRESPATYAELMEEWCILRHTRLQRLSRMGVAEYRTDADAIGRYAYHVSQAGETLLATLDAMSVIPSD